MSRFTDELTVTQLSGARGSWRRWRLHEALVFERGDKGSGRLIVAPMGFVSDGPTIPRAFWAILPVWGSWGRAGILHDYLCARIEFGHPHHEARTRAEADRIFYEAMTTLGVGPIVRDLLWLGARVGAWLGIRANMIDFNRDLLRTELEE